MRLIDADALIGELHTQFFYDGRDRTRVYAKIQEQPTVEERMWIPCSEPPDNAENVFIAHGSKNFMTCCTGHYDHDGGLWYEDRNWFARPIYDGMYWCEMPMLPETEG